MLQKGPTCDKLKNKRSFAEECEGREELKRRFLTGEVHEKMKLMKFAKQTTFSVHKTFKLLDLIAFA